jgi:hypothetical protein
MPMHRNLPAAAAASKKHPIWVLSGVVAYFALCFVVGFLIGTAVLTRSTSMRQTANEALLLLFGNAAPSITAGNAPEAGRVTSSSGVAGGDAGAVPLAGAQPSQNRRDQTEAAPGEQSPKAQGDQADGSISPPQSSPSQTAKTQSSAAETASLSIPQQPKVAPTQVFDSPASTQIMADHDGPELLPSEAATPQAPEASSIAPQRHASISVIVPLPRSRPVVSAVPSDRPRHRIAPLGEGARGPLSSVFGALLKSTH